MRYRGWLVIIPAIAFVAAVVIGLVAQQRIGKRVAASLNEASQRQSLLVESISTVETIKSLRAEAYLLRKWREHSKNAANTSEKIKQLSAAAANMTQFIQQLVTVALVVAGAYAFDAGAGFDRRHHCRSHAVRPGGGAARPDWP